MCTGSTADLDLDTNFYHLTTLLKTSTSCKDFTDSLEQLHTQLPSLTASQADSLWSCIPSSHLSQLASVCLTVENESNVSLDLLVSLLSSMRSSPHVLHSLSYISFTPLLLTIAYEKSVAMEIRQLALECLECASYIPDCQSLLLHKNALCILSKAKAKQSNISHTILSNLGQSTSFCGYSRQVIEVLHLELSSCKELEKYEYAEHIMWVLGCFEQFQFTSTHTLILFLRDLFILLRNKVDAERRLLVLRATSLVLSLFNLHSLCEYTSVGLTLNGMLDLLLLVANLNLVNFKLWLDMYMHSGGNHYFLSLPMIAYTQQLIRMLEEVEDNDCIFLKNSDKCYDFICKSLLAVEDTSISLCHLLVFVEENSNHLEPRISRSVLGLLSLYLADHELEKHMELLTKLCPILIKLLCTVPMENFRAEINTFDASLLCGDLSSLCDFSVRLEDKLSEQMTGFLPVALNMSQHTQLPMAPSGYLHLLTIYFSKLYVTPYIGKTAFGNNIENKSVILEILLTMIPSLPGEYPLYKLALSLILTNIHFSSQSISQLEHKLITLLVNGLSNREFISSLPRNLAETLQQALATSVVKPLKQ